MPEKIIWTTCLTCCRSTKRAVGSSRFCCDDHETIWWESRFKLATVTKHGLPSESIVPKK